MNICVLKENSGSLFRHSSSFVVLLYLTDFILLDILMVVD